MRAAWIAWTALLACTAPAQGDAGAVLRTAIERARAMARSDAAAATKTIEAALDHAVAAAKSDASGAPTPSDLLQAYRLHAACSERIPGHDAIAERSYRAALRHYEEVDSELRFELDRSYAVFLRSRERPARALTHARRAWSLTERGTDVCAQSLLAVASCLTDLGRDAEVIRLLEAEFLPREAAYSIPAQIYLSFALALAHLEAKEVEAAGMRASRAFDLARAHPEAGLENLATQRYATILLGCGRQAEAVPLLRSAYSVLDAAAPPARRIQTAINLGRSLQELARGTTKDDEALLSEAAGLFRDAIEVAEAGTSSGDFETAWSHYRLASCLRQLGKLGEAADHIQKATVILLRLSRAERKVPELHGQHQRALRIARVFHGHASLLLDLPGDIDEAKVFDLVEAATSSLDIDALDLARFDRISEAARMHERRHPNTSMRDRWMAANARMLRATRRLFAAPSQRPATAAGAAPTSTLAEEVEGVFEELRALEDELGAPPAGPMRVHLDACMATLQKGEAILQLVVDVERPFAMVVTPDACTFLRLPAEASDFEARAQTLLASIAPRSGGASLEAAEPQRGKPARRPTGRPVRAASEALAEVSKALLPDAMRETLGQATCVYVVGTARSAGFPYEVLSWGEQGRWIDHGPAVVHLSSASLLARLRDREELEARSSAVLAGCPSIGAAEPSREGDLHWRMLDEIPKTHDELEQVRRMLDEFRDFSLVPSACVRLEGADATEARFFDALDDARFVHVATHGLTTSVGKRSFGGVVFSMAEGTEPEDDGFLSIRELFTNRWRGKLGGTELVVLSACETATSGEQGQQTASTLPLGFLFAGCRCVVGTMWKVQDDATAAFMAKFYEELARDGGRDRAGALHRAKQWAAKAWPETRHWAPFAMFGSGRETR